MAMDAKKKALGDVRRAQSKFEKAQQELSQGSEVRRKSFERARNAGATLREIGDAAGLHWSSVAEAIRKT
jgi:hypothetical protein